MGEEETGEIEAGRSGMGETGDAGGEEGFDIAILVDTEYPGKEQVSDPIKHIRVKEFLAMSS